MYGLTGAGKTRLVNDTADSSSEETYHKNSGKYWKGYRGEKQVIFDDFDGTYDLQDFLRWTDRGRTRIKIYHTECELCSTYSYVTSNRPPWMFYLKHPPGDRAGIIRRFTVYKCKWVVKDVVRHPPMLERNVGYASIMEVDVNERELWGEWQDMHHMIPESVVVRSESDEHSDDDNDFI